MLYLASFATLIVGLAAQDELESPGIVSEGSCYSDDDCTRMQVCVDSICQYTGGDGSSGSKGTRSKGTGSKSPSMGDSKGMGSLGECQYDGSLGYNTDSQTYESECMRLSMAECMTAGPRGRCTYVPSEGSAIGCTWDGTGCAEGCSPANMESRCSPMSHDQAACEGDEGQEMRCKWSRAGADAMGTGMEHPADSGAVPEGESAGSSMFDKVGLFKVGSEMSSRDIFLVVLLTVTAVIGLYQLYRWCINWKLHREYKLVNTSDPAPRSNHCIIDGQAYF